MEQVKKCSKCGEEKPKTKEFFGWKLKSKGYFRSECKVCEKERGKVRWAKRDDNQKKSKRERDRVREAKKRKEKPDYYRLAQIKRLQSENFKRWYEGYKALNKEKSFLKKIGSFCDITAFNCRVCGRPDVKMGSNKPKLCKGCFSKNLTAFGLRFNKTEKEIMCRACGIVHYGKMEGSYCPDCSKARALVAKKMGRRKRKDKEGSYLKRCNKYGVLYTPINRVDVYSRDGWKCVYCGVQVVRTKHYAANQATLDHVIPLSKGGTHTMDNVVSACQQCNSVKRDHSILKIKKTNQLLLWLR